MATSNSGILFTPCDDMRHIMEGNEDLLGNKTCEPEKTHTVPYISNDSIDQAASNSGSLYAPCDDTKHIMECDEDLLGNKTCKPEETDAENMIEVEILPMMMTDQSMIHPMELPFASLVSPLQPSTSADTQRKSAETKATERRSGQSQYHKASCRRGGSISGEALEVVKGNHAASSQAKRVVELYLTDKDVPPTLKDMISESEASRKVKTVRQVKKRRKLSVGDHERKGSNKKISIANVLFDGDYSALNFRWLPMSSFIGKQEFFQPDELPGPRKPTTCCYEAFRQFWDDEILEHIVRETNRNGSQLSSSSPTVWIDTNKHEILILFVFWMMLGVIQMPTVNSCFSKNALFKTTIFRKLLSKKRYWLLNRALYFVDNATYRPNSSKLFHLGPVVEHLNKKFSEAYTLSQDVVIDESLTLWKGSLSFKQRIKTKTAQEGIKTFELCESSTGYLWSFIIYSGKDPTASPSVLPKSMEIVLQLMKPLLNKGYRLFLDNWYNSPLLARFLKRNNTDCVGTLQKTQKDIPDLIKLATIPEGTCVARHSGDVAVMAYQNKRTVYTLSTCHGTDSVPVYTKSGRILNYKPAVIVDYKKYKDGMVSTDQMLEPYLIERKRCQQWYKKMFKRLLNISILNSRIIVGNSANDQKVELAFRLKLAEKIMANHSAHTPIPGQDSVAKFRLTQEPKIEVSEIFTEASDLPIVRFIGSHFIMRNLGNQDMPKTEGKSRFSNGRVLCFWCLYRYKEYRKTVWICEQCNVPLCLERCFKAYHTFQ